VVEGILALNDKSEPPGPRQLGAAEFAGSEAKRISRVSSVICFKATKKLGVVHLQYIRPFYLKDWHISYLKKHISGTQTHKST
jgi:hypothetical protein